MSIFNQDLGQNYVEGQFLVSRSKTSTALTGADMNYCVVLRNELDSKKGIIPVKILSHKDKKFIGIELYASSVDFIPYGNLLINQTVSAVIEGKEESCKILRFISCSDEIGVEVSKKGGTYLIGINSIKQEKEQEPAFLPPLTADYIISDEVKAMITKDMQDLLEKFLYSWTYAGVDKIIGKYIQNKTPLIGLLSKHPKWNPNKLQIRLEQKLKREIEVKEINKFLSYFRENFKTNSCYLDELKIDGKGYDELKEEFNTYSSLVELVTDFKDSINMKELLGDLDYEMLVSESERLREIISRFSSGKYSKESQKKQDIHNKFVDFLCVQKEAIITTKTADNINKYIPEIKANSGQKLGRVINKFCKIYGYCDFEIEEDVRVPIVHEDGTVELDSEGHSVLQTVKKMVKPYEREFALLSDKLSPKDIVRPLIISVNPKDYLTMSFGNSWTSCHSIDNGDIRRTGNGGSSGCNCLGTMSYMCDPSTIVMYTVSDSYEGEDYETQDKINRCLFHYGEGKLIQARVYPQNTDCKKEIYDSFREPVLQLFSDCLGIDCTWETSTDNDLKNKYINTVGYHYTDYTSNNGSNISAPIQFKLNQNKFTIGSMSTCVTCGETMQSNKKNKLSCCHEAKKEVHEKFRKTHPLTGSDPKDEVCSCCGKPIKAGRAVEIDGKYYHSECTFYCSYHQRQEPKPNTHEPRYVYNFGYVCKEALDSGEFFECDECGELFKISEKVVINNMNLCRSCYDNGDEEFDEIDEDVEEDELW